MCFEKKLNDIDMKLERRYAYLYIVKSYCSIYFHYSLLKSLKILLNLFVNYSVVYKIFAGNLTIDANNILFSAYTSFAQLFVYVNEWLKSIYTHVLIKEELVCG